MISFVKGSFLFLVILVSILVLAIFIAENLHIEDKGHPDKLNGSSPSKTPRDTKVFFNKIIECNRSFDLSRRDLLVLLHIQKTGGTTFERHLVQDLDIDPPCSCSSEKRRCYCPRASTAKQLVTIADYTWLLSRFSTGWICGLHPDWTQLTKCLKNLDNLFFITFLRHPVHRFVSEFRHVQRGATWKASKSHCKKFDTQLCYKDQESWLNVSLDDFLNCPNNMAINRQTRMLADLDLLNCNDIDEQGIGVSPSENVMLSSAKRNLADMAFFGICEKQVESQLVFEKTLSLKFKNAFKQSEDNKTKVFVDNLPTSVRDRILELNDLDMKLYNYAVSLFMNRKERLDCASFNSTCTGEIS